MICTLAGDKHKTNEHNREIQPDVARDLLVSIYKHIKQHLTMVHGCVTKWPWFLSADDTEEADIGAMCLN